MSRKWHFADAQIGIVVLIVGSILPGMHYSFHDNPILQGLYMAGILTAGITSGYVSRCSAPLSCATLVTPLTSRLYSPRITVPTAGRAH